ncbi:Mitochondrial rho gtpase [Thalictrum thalictroides]|uniref:Mitochondrial Rho GTPase n=1 Tax=Thalictrum thalictroides TaxID=46969 RepID=A0A7J6VSX5_THATH|nr:Mitochondrial rho gtpase [Thalictrum thalictroides]
MGNTTGKASSGNPKDLRVVVIGDSSTGKSSLIVSAITQTFSTNAPPLLPPTLFHAHLFPDPVPLILVDTSSRLENERRRDQKLRKADGVVITYSCDRLQTLDRLTSFWLPTLRQLKLNVPVVVVGCKSDGGAETKEKRKQVLVEVTQQFEEIESCIECSAANPFEVLEVIYCVQRAVLYPQGPMYYPKTQTLKPRCEKALKWIFKLCDHDRDGSLNDEELSAFLAKCLPTDIEILKQEVKEKIPEGFNDCGLTLRGFLSLHEHLGCPGTWTVLRRFGYDSHFRLRDNILPASFERSPDQSVELTNEAIEFLKQTFFQFDQDNDGALGPAELEDLFSRTPESPWSEARYKDAVETTESGGLLLDGFLSQWTLMTLLEPAKSLANLFYIGYEGDSASAFHITRRRLLDRKKQQSERNVFQCFVFGPNLAGKSTILNSLLRRSFSESYTSNKDEQFAVNVVDQIEGTKKTLVLREIPVDEVSNLLSSKESLASCDVAIFVHDCSSILSCTRATELLVAVASHGKDSGFEVPCLIVATKSDRGPNPLVIKHSTRVSQDMGLEAPITVGMKLGELSDVFYRIIRAAERPHLGIPESEENRNTKQYRHLVNHSLIFLSAGAAVSIAALVAYRVYVARKNTSS